MRKLTILLASLYLLTGSCSSDDEPRNNSNVPVCDTPTNIVISETTTNTVSISWLESTEQLEVLLEYGPTGFEIGTGTALTISESPFILSELDSGTNYDFYLKTLCEDDLESEISGLYTFSTLCIEEVFYGDVVLVTQEEVESFGASCYFEIEGSLTIGGEGSDIESLASLDKLVSIQGNLRILETELLTSLSGLENLQAVGQGYLKITSNLGLSSLEGLSGLIYVHEGISVVENPNLSSLIGLENLFDAQNEFYEIYIRDNASLSDLNLGNATYINGLYLYNNDMLTSLSSLEGLETNYEMYIENNDLLSDFCSLQNLFMNGTYIEGNVSIQNNLYNPSIQNIEDGICSE